jgi:hypothetical protein
LAVDIPDLTPGDFIFWRIIGLLGQIVLGLSVTTKHNLYHPNDAIHYEKFDRDNLKDRNNDISHWLEVKCVLRQAAQDCKENPIPVF